MFKTMYAGFILLLLFITFYIDLLTLYSIQYENVPISFNPTQRFSIELVPL